MPFFDHILNISVRAQDDTQGAVASVTQSLENLKQTASKAFLPASEGVGGLSSAFGNAGRAAGVFAQELTHATDPLQAALHGIEIGLENISHKMSSMGMIGAAFAALIPVVAGISAANELFTKSLRDASKETLNLIQVTSVYTGMGRGSTEAAKELTDQMIQLSRSTSFASQDVVAAGKKLIGLSQIANENLMPALQTAIDFAAYANVPVEEAANIVRFAVMGQSRMLRYWGINISEAARASGDMGRVLGEINKMVGGQEAAKINTYSGAVSYLGKAFNQTEKAIGHVLEEALIPVLHDLTSYFRTLGKEIEGAFKAGQFDPFIEKLQEMFQELGEGVKKGVESIKEFVKNADFAAIVQRLFTLAGAIERMGLIVGKVIGFILELPNAFWIAVAAALALKTAYGLIVKAVQLITVAYGRLLIAQKEGISAARQATRDDAAETVAIERKTAAIERETAALRRRNAIRRQQSGAIVQGYEDVWGGVPSTTPEAPTKKQGTLRRAGKLIGKVGAAGMGVAALADIGQMFGLGGPPEGQEERTTLGSVSGALAGISSVSAMLSFVPVVGEVTGLIAAIAGLGSILAGLADKYTLVGQASVDAFNKQQKETKLTGQEMDAFERSYGQRIFTSMENGERLFDVEKKLREEIKKAGEDGIISANGVKNAEMALAAAVRKVREEKEAQNKAVKELMKGPQVRESLYTGLDEKVAKEQFKTLNSDIERYYSQRRAAAESSLAFEKAIISESTNSEIMTRESLANAEMGFSQRVLADAESKYATLRKNAEEYYGNELSRILGKATEANSEETREETEKLERERTEEIKKIEDERTKAYQAELNKRIQSYQAYVQKIKTLENDLQTLKEQGIETDRKFDQATMTTQQKIESNLEAIRNRYAQAVELMPTMPEKALSLFKEVSSQTQSMVQDIHSLEQALSDTDLAYANMAGNIQKIGASATKKFQIELAETRRIQAEMQKAWNEGALKRAQQLARQGAQKAVGLAQQEGQVGGAKTIGTRLLSEFYEQEKAMEVEELDTAKQRNDEMRALNEKAREGQEQIIQQQLEVQRQLRDADLALISALKENTAAMHGNTAALIPEELGSAGGTAGGALSAGYGALPEGVSPSQAGYYLGLQGTGGTGAATSTGGAEMSMVGGIGGLQMAAQALTDIERDKADAARLAAFRQEAGYEGYDQYSARQKAMATSAIEKMLSPEATGGWGASGKTGGKIEEATKSFKENITSAAEQFKEGTATLKEALAKFLDIQVTVHGDGTATAEWN